MASIDHSVRTEASNHDDVVELAETGKLYRTSNGEYLAIVGDRVIHLDEKFKTTINSLWHRGIFTLLGEDVELMQVGLTTDHDGLD